MGLKKQVKKLQEEGKREFAKVKKKMVRAIAGDPVVMEAFLRAVADDEALTENFLASVVRNEKLYGLLKHSIESDQKLMRPLSPASVPTPAKKRRYIGPKDNEFENAHAVLAYWKAEGLSNEMAGKLTDARLTPHKIFLIEDLNILRKKIKRIGDVTIWRLQENKGKNTRAEGPRPTAHNIPDPIP